MGKAGQALRQVLEKYSISQNKIAVLLGVQRYAVYRWYHEQADPSGETIRRSLSICIWGKFWMMSFRKLAK
jgi:transcriptional regulator with XRE-family HTH domain